MDNPVEARARERIEARGLHVDPFGEGWRVHGDGTDLLCTRLASLSDIDLRPAPAKTNPLGTFK